MPLTSETELNIWHYRWRRYMGWFPIQFCMICGERYWAGFPQWDFRHWCWQWLPWWGDYCSKECCDEDLEFCAEMFGGHRVKKSDE